MKEKREASPDAQNQGGVSADGLAANTEEQNPGPFDAKLLAKARAVLLQMGILCHAMYLNHGRIFENIVTSSSGNTYVKKHPILKNPKRYRRRPKAPRNRQIQTFVVQHRQSTIRF